MSNLINRYHDLLDDEFPFNMFRSFFNSSATLGVEYQKSDDKLVVSIDMPGVKEEDISVEVSENIVSIKGQRKTQNSSYEIKKSFSIPENYNQESLQAELSNGVLTLTLSPKPLLTKEVKKISVNSTK